MESPTLTAPRAAVLHLKKILVPVDFSEPSEQALTYALRFATEFGAELTLLYVLEESGVGAYAEVALNREESDEKLSTAKASLHALESLVKGSGPVKIRSRIRHGPAAHQIVEAAKEFDTDLIVIATHGYTGWKHFCIGSTTESVVRTAPCPVFVVREKEHDFI